MKHKIRNRELAVDKTQNQEAENLRLTKHKIGEHITLIDNPKSEPKIGLTLFGKRTWIDETQNRKTENLE